uniref:Putative conserved secreted protein n=1 Tax=Ixodes scapularis TaxID=6945 RepID=A0A4D5S2B8_IXOSC
MRSSFIVVFYNGVFVLGLIWQSLSMEAEPIHHRTVKTRLLSAVTTVLWRTRGPMIMRARVVPRLKPRAQCSLYAGSMPSCTPGLEDGNKKGQIEHFIAFYRVLVLFRAQFRPFSKVYQATLAACGWIGVNADAVLVFNTGRAEFTPNADAGLLSHTRSEHVSEQWRTGVGANF